ncbi:MAG: M48 family metallopeptidase [Chloroflexi bacterium]|nr:M48 family metallopeptidase [Chloroflexota bacterium]
MVRSERRTKTISAKRRGGQIVVYLPAGMSPDEETRWVERMVGRVLTAERRRTLSTDDGLATRAQELNEQYFGGHLTWASICFVPNQQHRFGSCTPSNCTIRLSDRLQSVPRWVLDYVIVHELAHLIEANHGPRFWRLVKRYPLAERARGYLMALGLEEQTEE